MIYSDLAQTCTLRKKCLFQVVKLQSPNRCKREKIALLNFQSFLNINIKITGF